MPQPLLVIITGLPATGKTTLGQRIAADLCFPFVYKDGIKESLFDTLDWSDIAWSQKLGRASVELLCYFAEAQLKACQSCVVESNFDAKLATPKFAALKAKYDFAPVQIICQADPAVIWQRYQARWDAGEKHRGHVQHLDPRGDAWIHWQQGSAMAMDIGGEVIVVDTTDFGSVNYDALLAMLRGVLKNN